MERIKSLNGYQKFIVLVLITMFAVFTVLYAVTISRAGFGYMGSILVVRNENSNTVYAGKIDGKQARFAVSSDGVVTFTYGDKTYGPYTVKKDMTAIPPGKNCTHGVEIREGNKILFRGGYFDINGLRFFYNEDGTSATSIVASSEDASSEHGITVDSDGNVVDTMAPSASTLIRLVEDPELTHKGSWIFWFGCLFLSAMVMVDILFADELFRWRLSFRVQDVDMAEPSDWEICRRYSGWGISVILILILYIVGLQ